MQPNLRISKNAHRTSSPLAAATAKSACRTLTKGRDHRTMDASTMDAQDEASGEPQNEAHQPNMDETADSGARAADEGENTASNAGEGVETAGAASGGGIALRPVFLGNLTVGYKSEEVAEIFNKPIVPRDVSEGTYNPFPVDRVDLKRGYCFVFLKDASSATEKEQVVCIVCYSLVSFEKFFC